MPDLMNLFYDGAQSYQEMFQTILQDFEYDGYTLHYPFGHGTPGGGNNMYAVASIWYRNGNLWTTDKYQRFGDAIWNESRFTYYDFPVFTTYEEGMKYARGLSYDASQIVRGTPITPSPVINIMGNGGGATHIAKVTGQLSALSSNLSDILIVSGGGGGGMIYNNTSYAGADAGGISGSGSNSGNQSTGYAFGLGEAGINLPGGGSGLYGGYKGGTS